MVPGFPKDSQSNLRMLDRRSFRLLQSSDPPLGCTMAPSYQTSSKQGMWFVLNGLFRGWAKLESTVSYCCVLLIFRV